MYTGPLFMYNEFSVTLRRAGCRGFDSNPDFGVQKKGVVFLGGLEDRWEEIFLVRLYYY